jgi:TonB family protein
MNHRAIRALFLLTLTPHMGLAGKQRTPEAQYDVKRCAPKVAWRKPPTAMMRIRFRNGEKWVGDPQVAFDVLESGEVVNAHVERSSGIPDLDAYALSGIQSTKYNRRTGCGAVHSEATALIHFER